MSNHTSDTFEPELIEKLAKKTPFFVFNKEKILRNFQEYKKFFPGALIHYALKANSEPQVLKLLATSGSGFEVASIYELKILQKINVSPDRIIYGTSVKPAASIKEFFKFGIDRFAFDSFPELEKLAQNAPGAKVYVRTLADDSGSVFKFSEKFGTGIENVIPLLLRAKELGLKPFGISFHVGSQASDPMAWANAIKDLKPIIKELQGKGITLDILNIGGGYPCKYLSAENAPTLDKISKNIFEEVKKLPYNLKLMLEPGRGMIANTAVAVATIIARVERKGNTWLFLDLGVYNGLFETMAYQGSTRYLVTSLRPGENSGQSIFALAGPTGDSPDVITHEAMLPSDIEVGEKLIFHDVGAYSLVVTSPFNGFPKPEVYYI